MNRRVNRVAPGAHQYQVRMRDGIRLATDVYLPDPLPGRVAAVLVRACYGKTSDRLGLPRIAAYLNSRGYGLVAQDVRGSSDSDGERTPWLHEAGDGFDTIDWVVRQSWCDERVGMLGDSYLGFTQWAAAASGHPGLLAIAPRVASERVPGTWFAADVASPVGAQWLARWWSGPGPADIGGLSWDARPYIDAIPAGLRNARKLHREFLSLGESELHAAIYPAARPAARLAIPALHAGAWFDVMTPYQMRDWSVVSGRSPAAGEQYLVMAADDHDGTPLCAAGGDEARRAAADAAWRQRLDRTADFFDRYLRGTAPSRPVPRVRYQVAHAGWRSAPCWPPAGATERSLFLDGATAAAGSEDGGVLSARPGRPGRAEWVHDPADPVPSLVPDDNAMLAGGLPDEAAVHRRGDVLTFTGPPADVPLDIVGPVALDAAVCSSAPSMHLIATLADVDPAGRVTLITEGIARIGTRHGPSAVTVPLGPVAYRLRRGHRLRVALASSRYPRYLVHPGTGDNIWTAVQARPARQTLRVGGPGGSRLRLRGPVG